MGFESRLIPILREGVEIVKMLSFKKLKEELAGRYPEREPAFAARLAGALVASLFAAEAADQPSAGEFPDLLSREQAALGAMLGELRTAVTDALRIQALCDHQEGLNSTAALRRAQDLGVLLAERELPLPHRFIELVRRLGNAAGLIAPPSPENAGLHL